MSLSNKDDGKSNGFLLSDSLNPETIVALGRLSFAEGQSADAKCHSVR